MLEALANLEGVPVDEIPAVLGDLETLRARLQARHLQAILLTTERPANPAPNGVPEFCEVEEAARIVRRSVSWMEKYGRKVPGFRQLGGKGARLEWNREALLRWANASA